MDGNVGTQKPKTRFVVLPQDADEARVGQIIAKIKVFHNDLMTEMHKVIVGQEDVIDLIMIAILCRGNVLLEGVPGLGKTLIFRTLSKIMDLSFRHVQFTPDLMPSDII